MQESLLEACFRTRAINFFLLGERGEMGVRLLSYILQERLPPISSGEPRTRSTLLRTIKHTLDARLVGNIDTILHCESLDVDEIECATERLVQAKPSISPMGEAILKADIELIQILLQKGANTNVWGALNPSGGLMARVTSLIAAIDKQALSIVELLVRNAAELQYERTFGIQRTLLQRVAGIGAFDIVRYLVDQKADIDTVTVHSGGTALRLAATNGYVGIATFLLERGADPNYPPAEGHGGRAFEAAAGRGRMDMMSLPVQRGVQFDLKFGKFSKRQYNRALRLSRQKGHMAANRFVEQLYKHVLERWTMQPMQGSGIPLDPLNEASPSAWESRAHVSDTGFVY